MQVLPQEKLHTLASLAEQLGKQFRDALADLEYQPQNFPISELSIHFAFDHPGSIEAKCSTARLSLNLGNGWVSKFPEAT